MSYFTIKNALAQTITGLMLALALLMLTPPAGAADDVTLACKKANTDAALDFSTLGLNISPTVPVGTVVYSGSFTVQFKCALDNIQQFADGKRGEVYFKRKAIADDTLGYGLTIYTGYGGDMSREPASIATGNYIITYALTSGGTVGAYTDVSLTVPFEIVRTSTSMNAAKSLRDYVNVFDVGSFVTGSDLNFYFTNIKKGITVKDETCSATGQVNQTVPLGSYSTSKSSGLGAGIGQTSSPIPFSIKLNCEALLSGTFDVMMQFDGDVASGLSEAGVVRLNATSTASGVGVQILNENQQPVALGTPFSVASYPLAAALVTVPLYARYYQLAETVTPGSADAVATYTLSYQ